MERLPLTGNVSHKLNKRLTRATRKKARKSVWKRHKLGFWLPEPEKDDHERKQEPSS